MITTLVDSLIPVPLPGDPRSEGIHVSSVLRCIAAENGVLKPEYVESMELVDTDQEGWWKRLPPNAQLKMSMGLAWDGYYLVQLGNVVLHPGEMLLDGIYMTPDGESLDILHVQSFRGMVIVIHEVKLTYKSTKTVGDLGTQWLWLAQAKAYCKAKGTRFAYLHVLFVCGDYKFPINPVLKVWLIEFTQEEIDEGWDIITGYVQHRRMVEREDAGLEGGS